MKEFFKKNIFNIIVMLCYSIVTFIIMIYHQSWRDEAQAWLIAGTPSVLDLIKQIMYEGHPALWHMILRPFAIIGLPYVTTKVISWLICNVAAWLILKKASFNKVMKVLFLFTLPMIYLYPSISRSYCLIPLALTLIAIFYEQRHEKPIKYILSILLLVNTHVLMYGLVGILLVLFYFEELIQNRKTNTKEQKKKIYISLAIIVVGLIIAMIPMLISVLQNEYVSQSNGSKLTGLNLQRAGKTIANIFGQNFYCKLWTRDFALVLFALILIYQLIFNRKNFLITFCSFGFQILVYVLLYDASNQRANLLILIMMFILWIQSKQDKENKFRYVFIISVGICFVFNIIHGILVLENDLTKGYSASQEAAKYINENIDENSIFICNDMPYSSAITPYVKNRFWSIQIQDYFTYVVWNDGMYREYDIDGLKQLLDEKFTNNEKLYFLYSYQGKKEEEIIDYVEKQEDMKNVFESKEAVNERYIIYEIQR